MKKQEYEQPHQDVNRIESVEPTAQVAQTRTHELGHEETQKGQNGVYTSLFDPKNLLIEHRTMRQTPK